MLNFETIICIVFSNFKKHKYFVRIQNQRGNYQSEFGCSVGGGLNFQLSY